MCLSDNDNLCVILYIHIYVHIYVCRGSVCVEESMCMCVCVFIFMNLLVFVYELLFLGTVLLTIQNVCLCVAIYV